jgi:apolipoprotein N-acyltransferase
VTDPANRPAWLLNVTNDGWYGISTGPHQHLAQVRFRTVEEGLPLVRVANTGISAVIDSYGRVTAEIPLGAEGIADADLPAALSEPTPYARFGDGILLGILAVAALPIGVSRFARRAS